MRLPHEHENAPAVVASSLRTPPLSFGHRHPPPPWKTATRFRHPHDGAPVCATPRPPGLFHPPSPLAGLRAPLSTTSTYPCFSPTATVLPRACCARVPLPHFLHASTRPALFPFYRVRQTRFPPRPAPDNARFSQLAATKTRPISNAIFPPSVSVSSVSRLFEAGEQNDAALLLRAPCFSRPALGRHVFCVVCVSSALVKFHHRMAATHFRPRRPAVAARCVWFGVPALSLLRLRASSEAAPHQKHQ
ncbi:hypothetical protein TRVL_09008 [Trypanosoma vivax]|nr:hypothetical protein TRVL_09008 [Trypanosoma vivax]